VAATLALVLTACGDAAGSADHPKGDPACATADLTASVGEFGSMASRPFLTVTLTNHTSAGCRLRGYPLLTVIGAFVAPPARPVHVVVTHGSTYERADPGPHSIVVAPHRFASFTVGTGRAYTGPTAGLHRFEIRPADDDEPLVVQQEMAANGPRGEPIPVTETALTLGIPGR
jgi:hypothetical protein